MDERKDFIKEGKIRGVDSEEADTNTQNEFKENELETLILKPTREHEGIYSLTPEERKRYISITKEELEEAKIKSPFIAVWEEVARQIRRLENKKMLEQSKSQEREDDESGR